MRGYYSVIEMAAKGVNWLFIVTMPLYLESKDFGMVALIYAAEVLICNVAVLGQDKFVLRYGHQHRGGNYIIACAAAMLMALIGMMALYAILEFSILWLGLYLAVILATVNRVFQMQARVLDNKMDFLVQRLLFLMLRVGAFYGAYSLGYAAADSFVLAFLFSALLVSMKPLCMVVAELKGLADRKRNSESIGGWSTPILFGFPISIHLGAASLLSHADKFVVAEHLEVEMVGVYSFSYMLATGITFAYAAIAIQLEPLIYKNSENASEREKYLFVFQCLGALLVPLYCVMLFVFLYGYYYFDSAVMHKIDPFVIVAGLAAMSLNVVYLKSSYRLYSFGKSASISFVTIAACLINVFLNLLLVPMFSLVGASISGLVSSTFLAVVMSVRSQKLNAVKLYKFDASMVAVAWLIVIAFWVNLNL